MSTRIHPDRYPGFARRKSQCKSQRTHDGRWAQAVIAEVLQCYRPTATSRLRESAATSPADGPDAHQSPEGQAADRHVAAPQDRAGTPRHEDQ